MWLRLGLVAVNVAVYVSFLNFRSFIPLERVVSVGIFWVVRGIIERG